MRNWMELHILAREKLTEAIRTAEETRRGSATTARTVDRRPASLILARGEVLRIRVRWGALRVTCRTGRLWATSDRDATDSILVPGDSVTYGAWRTVVIEALRIATLRLEYGEKVCVEMSASLRRALQFG